MKQLDGQQKELGLRMDETGAAIRDVQREDEDILRQMYAMDKDKEKLKNEVYSLHKMAKRYQALERGQYEAPEAAQVEQGLARAQERADVLAAVVQRLSGVDERLADSLAALAS